MPRHQIELRAVFSDPDQADAAAGAVHRAGFPPSTLTLEYDVLPEGIAREARFLRRVLAIIVLWSILGGIFGAAFGWLLAETMGPEGTSGLILQLVCWIIVGHLVAGMLAGYFVLADRSQREMPPDRPLSVITAHGLADVDAQKARKLLRSYRPAQLSVIRSRTRRP
jgi:hypothetical protein